MVVLGRGCRRAVAAAQLGRAGEGGGGATPSHPYAAHGDGGGGGVIMTSSR